MKLATQKVRQNSPPPARNIAAKKSQKRLSPITSTAWPKTVDIVLYPAGTWVSAVEPVINLGITYDHALLKTNKRVELFTEDGVLVGKRGFESRVVSVPVSVEGLVGARRAQAGAPAA